MMLLLVTAYLYAGFSVWFAAHNWVKHMIPRDRDSIIDAVLTVALWPVVMPILAVRRFR
jgi:hypothetical protein